MESLRIWYIALNYTNYWLCQGELSLFFMWSQSSWKYLQTHGTLLDLGLLCTRESAHFQQLSLHPAWSVSTKHLRASLPFKLLPTRTTVCHCWQQQTTSSVTLLTPSELAHSSYRQPFSNTLASGVCFHLACSITIYIYSLCAFSAYGGGEVCGTNLFFLRLIHALSNALTTWCCVYILFYICILNEQASMEIWKQRILRRTMLYMHNDVVHFDICAEVRELYHCLVP